MWTYTTIPSVREVLVLRSDRIAGEIMRRSADDVWPERVQPVSGELELTSIGFRMPLSELYARTGLTA